ncbi:MAG: hypothetical protein IKW89_08470 [Bacteroidales bacterium]|nr:hypothetical protein [Bacteroidales bacterium]
MALVKAVARRLPDGTVGAVLPFHVSFEGLEKVIICRDDQDCDTMVKCLVVCARRKNVIIIIYAVVSNHVHAAVLAKSLADAESYAREVKRTYSQLFRSRYGVAKVLRATDVKVQLLDTDWYLRNALAYIPRNAYDNGAESVADYKWTGFRAFFRSGNQPKSQLAVASMTCREWREIFHTGDNLGDVAWTLNEDYEVEPYSFCDVDYLEQAFNRDEVFFYRSVGSVNAAEMTQKLVISPRKMLSDAEFLKEVNAISLRWFMTEIDNLPISRKTRIIPFVYHTMKTTVPQLARVFGLSRDDVSRLLNVRL